MKNHLALNILEFDAGTQTSE